MKLRFSVVCLIAAGLFAVQANAQSFTHVDGSTTSGPYNDNPGPLAFNPDHLTQSADEATITMFNSVSCNAGGLHTDNSYLRRFDTSVLPLGFTSKDVETAVETATGAGGTQNVVVNVYSIADAAAFTFANLALQGTSGNFAVTDQAATLISVPVVATISPGDDMVLELFTPDGQTLGNSFFIGSNPNGQTGASYIAAADCGLPDPLDLAAIGFPGMHIILSVNGLLTPVEFVSFTSVVSGSDVSLNWETASETNNAGFEVQVKAGESWNALGFVEGHGTTTEVQTYGFNAGDMGVGTHSFRLKQIDFDGAFEYSAELEVAVETPGSHVLSAAYPNPFNPQSNFTLAVAQDQNVTAELFNTLGQRVAVLFDGTVEADQTQTLTIDGAGLASGMYVVRVNGERFNDALTVTLLK